MDKKEFTRLLAACHEIAAQFPDGVIFIGGIAVYLHAINCVGAAEFAEMTHDADFYASFTVMTDLRDVEEITPNRRLSKSQFIKAGFEFDVYVERLSSLIVPYSAVAANSRCYEAIRVASLEHLLALKLAAYQDRKGTAKGEKDAADIFRIGLVATYIKASFDPAMCLPYLSEDQLHLLNEVERSSTAAMMALGNAVTAKRIRTHFGNFAAAIRQANETVENAMRARLADNRETDPKRPKP